VSAFNANIMVKISVLQAGKVLADGLEISLADLDARLSQIKRQNGVVWYYRENGQGNPPQAAMDAIKLVVNHRLPISMSSKPDFSDVIDARGLSRPRE
jgi:hypothetical protein